MKKAVDKILKILSLIVMIFIVIIGSFLIYYFVSIKIYEQKGTGYEPKVTLYTIISRSMVPKINVYDVVFDIKIDKNTVLKKGDIITFISKSPDSYNYVITHRITNVSNNEYGVAYTTKGDNNNVEDEAKVYQDQVLGKVLFVIPQLGKIQTFIAYRGGWLILLALPAFGIIVANIVKIATPKLKELEAKKR
ncbi:MAG TPA: signal peptidase I [Bacilli bacterium]|nr:signal peptidase I [Bacilli bacterium]